MTKQIRQLTTMGMMAALSIILVFFIHFPLIPAAPFLEYDPADITILLCTLLFGPASGLLMTVAVSIIQGLTVSAAGGPIGIMMHIIATGSFVLVAGLIYKARGNKAFAILGLGMGVLTMTVVMCGLNLLLTPLYTGSTATEVAAMLIPVIIPFNLMKAGINAVLAFLLFMVVKRFYRE